MNDQEAVQRIEDELVKFKIEGLNICTILATVCANHLFSETDDNCHIDGKEFGALINDYSKGICGKK